MGVALMSRLFTITIWLWIDRCISNTIWLVTHATGIVLFPTLLVGACYTNKSVYRQAISIDTPLALSLIKQLTTPYSLCLYCVNTTGDNNASNNSKDKKRVWGGQDLPSVRPSQAIR